MYTGKTDFATAEDDDQALMKVPLYFEDETEGVSFLLTPAPPNGTGTTILGVDSNPIPGPYGYMPLGIWSTRPLTAPLLINGEFTCDLWVSSDNAAKTVRITISVLRDETLFATFNTSMDSLGETPTKIRFGGNISMDVQPEQTLVVRVTFDAPKLGGLFSEFAHVSLSYAGTEYPSGIIIYCNPFSIDIPEPDVTQADVTFRARVIEAFDTSPAVLNFTFSITGPTKPQTITETEAKKYDTDAGHPIVISVAWDYNKDNAKDGLYKVKAGVSYDGVKFFEASNSSDLKLPSPPPKDLMKTKITGTMIMYGAIAGVLVFAVIAYVFIVRPRYMAKKGLLARFGGVKGRWMRRKVKARTGTKEGADGNVDEGRDDGGRDEEDAPPPRRHRGRGRT